MKIAFVPTFVSDRTASCARKEVMSASRSGGTSILLRSDDSTSRATLVIMLTASTGYLP